jgi:arylsulfatase A-like enzyme
MISCPGLGPGTIDALTTNVDIHATLADLFGAEPEHRTHGRSLIPLVTGRVTSIREHALAGIWGRHVHVIDGDTKYARGHTGENLPLSMWSNRWSTMPISHAPHYRIPRPDARARLDFMPGSRVPVIRQPFQAGDRMPYWAMDCKPDDHTLFDLRQDPGERRNLAGAPLEKRAVDRLRAALDEVEAPAEQYQRLGIA